MLSLEERMHKLALNQEEQLAHTSSLGGDSFQCKAQCRPCHSESTYKSLNSNRSFLHTVIKIPPHLVGLLEPCHRGLDRHL